MSTRNRFPIEHVIVLMLENRYHLLPINSSYTPKICLAIFSQS